MKKHFAILFLLIATLLCGLWLGQAARPENFQLRGKLTFDAPQVPSADYEVGDFIIRWRTENGGQLTIETKGRPGFALWQTIPGEAFVIAVQNNVEIIENRGMFKIKNKWKDICTSATLSGIETDMSQLALYGNLSCASQKALHFYIIFTDYNSGQPLDNMGIYLEDDQGKMGHNYQIILNYKKDENKHFFGFGEQFTHFDMTGLKVPMWVSEQGVGRGEQPITFAANITNNGAGGNEFTSYAPIPFYVTDQMRSLRFQGYPGSSHYANFDLRSNKRVQIETFSPGLDIQILGGNQPQDILEHMKPAEPLPDWIYSRAIVGMQGGTEKVNFILSELEKRETPIAAFWLQDWVGQRTTSFGKQLWWNWELDTDRYPHWDQLITKFNNKNIRVLLYINPNLADVSEKTNVRRNLFKEALENGYLIRRQDGSPYLLQNTSFDYGMVDLGNMEAREWLVNVIQRNMLDIGASGWMADFGESSPTDALLSDNQPLHNEYPLYWLSTNSDAIRDSENQPVFFMRSGYISSVRYTPLFWEGDQLVDWSVEDGIKSAVTGLNTSGLSGMAFNHSDIGGYTTITSPIKNYHRSRELLYRWMEMNAFTLIFRTHEGNQPEKNVQFYTDDETLDTFAYWAKVYAALFDYRKQLVAEAVATGLPVVRHPFIHYPEDPETWKITYQEFMLGEDFLIAPVTDPGADEVEAYLPRGRWVHLWTGAVYGSEKRGEYATVPAPIGQPGVFYKEGSQAGEEFVHTLKSQGLLP